jgi:amino acid permease
MFVCLEVRVMVGRILLFYVLSIILIGLNGELLFPGITAYPTYGIIVPWDYPNLSNQSTTTSPFTIVFTQAGSREHILSVTRVSAKALANSYSGVIHEHCHPDLRAIRG